MISGPAVPIMYRFAPHSVPMGEGTVLLAPSAIQGFLLHPHPLADADTLRCKLAKASLRGEGQDEGRDARDGNRGVA